MTKHSLFINNKSDQIYYIDFRNSSIDNFNKIYTLNPNSEYTDLKYGKYVEWHIYNKDESRNKKISKSSNQDTNSYINLTNSGIITSDNSRVEQTNGESGLNPILLIVIPIAISIVLYGIYKLASRKKDKKDNSSTNF